MIRKITIFTLLYIQSTFFITVFALSPLSLSVEPEKILQGSPLMTTINGTSTLSGIESISFEKKKLSFFMYKEMPRAFYGVDINKKSGTYTVTAVMNDKTVLTKEITVEAREKIEAPLGIPKALGGNTAKSAKKLVNTLATENASLNNLFSEKQAFWKDAFQFPVTNPIVTDDYGYSRQTDVYSIAHKGTDFRASIGTDVFAMNQGVVRVAKTYRNYGNTIVVDHGDGLMTLYMHLSKIKVKVGQLVTKGQVIGESGNTGYAEGAHLHVSVRINDISIDPMTFMGFFK